MTDFSEVTNLLKAIAHPARLEILALLRNGEICVCHLERALGKRQAYISQQLMVLRESGIVGSRKDGLQVYYWLTDERIHPLLNLLCTPNTTGSHPRLEDCPCPACNSSELRRQEQIHVTG